jgi:hypothetical protein
VPKLDNQYNPNNATYSQSNAMNDTSSDDDEDDYSYQNSESKDDDDDENENLSANNEITLNNLMSSMGVKNVWATSVPARFLSVVFAAAQGKLFSIKQAKALCELYKV